MATQQMLPPKWYSVPVITLIGLVIILPIALLFLSFFRYLMPVLFFVDSPTTLWILSVCGVLGILLAVGFLLSHRAVAEGRFEAFSILITLTAVTENIFLSLKVMPMQDAAFPHGWDAEKPGEIRLILTIILLYMIALSIAHLILANVRRDRTEERVKEVLSSLINPGTDGLRAIQLLSLGKALIQDDYFPGYSPHQLFNAKRQYRQLFLDMLRASGNFDTVGVGSNAFLVIRLEQQKKLTGTPTTNLKVPPPEVDRNGHLGFAWASTISALAAVLWMSVAAALFVLLSHGS